MEKIKVAVIGCGGIANHAHLPAYAANENCELKYCVDIIEDRAKAAQEKFGFEKYLTNYKDILNDASISAVSVCTPNGLHDTISIDFLNAGKNVLCEKPIANDANRAKVMLEAAQKNHRILNIGVCKRFSKTVNEIKSLIDQGTLGEVFHIYCSFRSHRNIPGLGGAFTSKEASGGGVLIDWGVHFLDLIIYSTGIQKVHTVSANMYNKLGKNISEYTYVDMWAGPPKLDGVVDVEEFVTGFIRTDGPSITFNGAWAQNIGEEEMFVDFIGDKAGVRMNYMSGDYTLYNVQNGILYKCEPKYHENNAYTDEVNAFIQDIMTNTKGKNNIENVIINADLMDAIYKSAIDKEEIKL
jgi:predicted dehydrogenase